MALICLTLFSAGVAAGFTIGVVTSMLGRLSTEARRFILE